MLLFLGYLVLSVALSLVAAELLRPDPPDIDKLKDDTQASAHVRGSLLPILLGYNKVTPIIGYVGNRRTWERKVGEIDGGTFHSDEDITQTEYRESGLHYLCIGPAYRLDKIIESGNVIFDTPISRSTTPSGSQFTCTDPYRSVFRIYWGEVDQPLDAELALLTGVATRYPVTCYIYWVTKELGGRASWKSLQYYLECSALGMESDYIDIDAQTLSFSVTRVGTQLTTTDIQAAEVLEGDVLTVSGADLKAHSVTESGGTYK